MFDAVASVVALLTIFALVAQLVAFAVPPYDGWTLLRRAAALGVWALLLFVAGIAFLMFNYCESNCAAALNWPTAGIALVVSLLDAGVISLSWLDIQPVWARKIPPVK